MIQRLATVSMVAGLIGMMGLSACNSSSPVEAGSSPGTTASSQTKTGFKTSDKRRVVATVDDTAIYEDELTVLIQAGADRAVALDRAINRVVMTRAAKEQYETQSQAAIDSATRDILSQLYLQKTTEKLSAGISDKEIKAWYDKRMTAEDFREYRAVYVLSPSAEEAAGIAAEAASGDRKTLSRFKPISDNPDQWLRARDFPYGLGQLVGRMKPGEISRPIALRNGWFVLMLKDSREGKIPSLESVKSEIRNILVSEALVNDISQIRQHSRIELK